MIVDFRFVASPFSSLMILRVQREMKRFLKRVCGFDAADATRDTYKHLMVFFNLTSKQTVELEDFCQEFVKEENFSTSQEADVVLTTILQAFDDYKRKKPIDPARTEKLTEIMNKIRDKGKEKYVCAPFTATH